MFTCIIECLGNIFCNAFLYEMAGVAVSYCGQAMIVRTDLLCGRVICLLLSPCKPFLKFLLSLLLLLFIGDILSLDFVLDERRLDEGCHAEEASKTFTLHCMCHVMSPQQLAHSKFALSYDTGTNTCRMFASRLGAAIFFFLITTVHALHFYLDANEKRCFIEELPSDTAVEGPYLSKTLFYEWY